MRDRRDFLKLAGAVGGSCAAALVPAEAAGTTFRDPLGILIDLTACAGCRTCEYVCAEANGLPEPEDEVPDERQTSEKQWTVVTTHETSGGEVYVKRQCMHCVEPACASACLTRALFKTDEGPVVWREDKCMGCRYCMISCPFDVPKFEYNSAVPRIMKCRMCFERLEQDEVPVCVENCPGEALTFGRRSELLEIARQRIYQNPGDYIPHIYGEREAGGTGILYISAVPFEELGLPTNLGDTPYPEFSRDFLTAVPIVLTLWPAFLLGLWRSTGKTAENEELVQLNSNGEDLT